ncbi:MAG TPA: hypothetical protein VF896_09285, partial [Anaerolineales bacterium]
PPQAQIVNQSANSIKLNLPFTPGTNLAEKYLQMSVNENVNPCQSPLSDTSRPGSPTETVVFNGIPFFKQIGGDAGAGNFHEWVGYSTLKNNACISMDFVLHSLAAGAFEPPVPEFDKVAESAVFTQVMSTFAWNAPPTPTATPTPTSTATPTTVAPPPVVASPLIDKLVMIDASNGWAIGNFYVLRTMDGGATWYNVTPPGAAGSIRSNFFPNINTGWVLISVSPPGPPGPGSLYRTTDGGLNWVHYDVPFNSGYLQFLDNTHGFVMTILGAAMNKQAVALYQTSDGGATWVRKYINDPTVSGYGNSLPLGGHKNGMTFRNITTGWVGGDTPADGFVYLYKTTNSGVTWSQQPLALPAGYESAETTTTAPTFFGLNDAILPVRMITSTGTVLFIYVSHNGGATWARSSASVHLGSNTDFLSVNNGFTWDATGLFHFTNNAGTSWSNITPNVNFGDSIRDMDFVSTTTGWVLDTDSNGNAALYRTNDGGATWTLLFGSVPASTPVPPPTASPVPSPAEFAQTIVNALNARNFDAVRVSMDQSFGFAFWQSQGTAYTPDLAIEQLRTNYIGASTVLVADPNKDLNALLGTNPYSIVGLDPANSQALFVSGWGLDGTDEAILYITRRADASLYWHSVLIAKGGLAPNSNSISHDAFCADTNIPILIEQLKGSMNQSNGDMFAGLVSPTHGVNVHLWAHSPAVNFSTTSAKTVFTSTDIYNWGTGPSLTPDTGTFKDIIQPKLQEVLNAPNMETYCDNLTNISPSTLNPWPYPNIHYYNLYKPSTPSTDLNFRTWLIGFEYINNQPYLYAMVTIVWGP